MLPTLHMHLLLLQVVLLSAILLQGHVCTRSHTQNSHAFTLMHIHTLSLSHIYPRTAKEGCGEPGLPHLPAAQVRSGGRRGLPGPPGLAARAWGLAPGQQGWRTRGSRPCALTASSWPQ